jgi:hypothetical protein
MTLSSRHSAWNPVRFEVGNPTSTGIRVYFGLAFIIELLVGFPSHTYEDIDLMGLADIISVCAEHPEHTPPSSSPIGHFITQLSLFGAAFALR